MYIRRPKRTGPMGDAISRRRAEDKLPLTGVCFNCKAPTTDEHYCYGCRAFICDKCDRDHLSMPTPHRKEHHTEEGCHRCNKPQSECGCEEEDE